VCDLICDVISLAVFEAALRVKSTHVIKSCLKTRKKEKYGNNRYFYINLYLKDRLDIQQNSQLAKASDATGSVDIMFVSDTYRQFAGQAQLLRSESRSRIEYLIPANNI